MFWNTLVLALVVLIAFGAAAAFHPRLRAGARARTSAWLLLSSIIALCPCLIPSQHVFHRFLASLISVGLLVKLFDLHQEPRLAGKLGLRSYLGYLPNDFWAVLRREPRPRPRSSDLRRLALAIPAITLALCWSVWVWRLPWLRAPFALEHTVKLLTFIPTLTLIVNALASVARLLGWKALDPMRSPLLAETPADFWRRWNRPAHFFFAEYAFRAAGGSQYPFRATLATFGLSGLIHEYIFGIATGRVDGWQFLFFALQGCAVAATPRRHPDGRLKPLWIAGTLGFNLATSFLFFRSLDAVLPFHVRRPP